MAIIFDPVFGGIRQRDTTVLTPAQLTEIATQVPIPTSLTTTQIANLATTHMAVLSTTALGGLTSTQLGSLTTNFPKVSATSAGLVPNPNNVGATNYLSADGTFSVPTGGANGYSVLSGSGTPADGVGVNGDHYFKTSTSDWYTKASGTWGTPVVNLKGATGANGTNGTNGTNGFSVLSGSNTPSDGSGVNGDHYFKTSNGAWYTKSGGTWGSAVYNLTGANGTNGFTVLTGSGAPIDGNGVNGDHYFRTDTFDWYTKAAGTWGSPTANLRGASGAGSGDILATPGTTIVGQIAVYNDTTGTKLKTSSKLATDVSFVNATETRSASINMADYAVQRPELKDWSETRTAPTSLSGAIALDMELGNVFTTTLTENITTLSITNPPVSGICGTITWIVTQDAGAVRSIALPTGGVWATGNAPDFTTLNGVYVLTLKTTNAGLNWVVSSAGGGGGGVSGLTAGGLVFGGSDGGVAQDANLQWDNPNNRLGIGTSTPSGDFEVCVTDTSTSYLVPANAITSLADGTTGGPLTIATDGVVSAYTIIDIRYGWGFKFNTQKTITKFRFYYGPYNNYPNTYKIQTWDGSVWTDRSVIAASDMASGSGMSITAGGNVTGWHTTTISAVLVLGIRAWVLTSTWLGFSPADTLCIYEMEAYAPTDTKVSRLSVSSSGVGVGTTTPVALLDTNNNADSLALRAYRAGTVTTDPIATFHSDIGGTAIKVCEIRNTGGIYNVGTVYGGLSDAKLKENITDATPKLADLLAVQVRRFNFIDQPGFMQIGVVAQELELLFPGLVESQPDIEMIPDPEWTPGEGQSEADRPFMEHDLGTVTKSVKYSVFVSMLIKALQELYAEHETALTALTARVAALEAV